MGGHALKVPTRRYYADEYQYAASAIIPKLREYFGTDVFVPFSYREKESFGDLDVLIKINRQISHIEKIEKINRFFPNEIARNSNCYSFDWNELQVDLIFTGAEYWETAKAYYSWNDLGNLMGKIARRLRLRWGHKGLMMSIYKTDDKSKKYADIVLTRDPKEAFDVLGFEYNRFLRGFDTLTDIFDFVGESTWYHPRAFASENLTSNQRIRDMKRTTYVAFTEWHKLYQPKQPLLKRLSHEETLEWMNVRFPDANVKATYEEKKELERLHSEATAKFNGRHLIELGYSGAELGQILRSVQSQYDKKREYYQWILDTPFDKIIERFKNQGCTHHERHVGRKRI